MGMEQHRELWSSAWRVYPALKLSMASKVSPRRKHCILGTKKKNNLVALMFEKSFEYVFEDRESRWLSGCSSSVAEHWRLKPEVSWVRLPVAAGFFTFLYNPLFPAWGKMLWAFGVRKLLSMSSFLMERIFRLTPNGVLTAHTGWLPGVRLRHSVPPVQYM